MNRNLHIQWSAMKKTYGFTFNKRMGYNGWGNGYRNQRMPMKMQASKMELWLPQSDTPTKEAFEKMKWKPEEFNDDKIKQWARERERKERQRRNVTCPPSPLIMGLVVCCFFVSLIFVLENNLTPTTPHTKHHHRDKKSSKVSSFTHTLDQKWIFFFFFSLFYIRIVQFLISATIMGFWFLYIYKYIYFILNLIPK